MICDYLERKSVIECKKIFYFYSLVLLIGLCFSSCSSSNSTNNDLRRYRISVSSDGRKVRNLNQRLIHEVDLPKSFVLRSAFAKDLGMPFTLKTEVDLRGHVAGLRVANTNYRSGSRSLGLLVGDLIMSSGKDYIRSTKDLNKFFARMLKDGGASLSVNRQGDAHKFIYTVVK